MSADFHFQPQSSFLQQSSAFNQAPKNREPPRYEEAVRQTRSLQNPTLSEVISIYYACLMNTL